MLYDTLTADQFTAANQAAKSLNLQVQALKLEIPAYDFAGAFQAAAAGGAQLMMVLSSPAFSKRMNRNLQSWRSSIVCLPCSPSSITSTVVG